MIRFTLKNATQIGEGNNIKQAIKKNKLAIILIILAITTVGILAAKAKADDPHCHCGRCFASCRCCAKYNPTECSRCSHRCGR